MPSITSLADTSGKLEILSRDSRYDLACACAPREDEHRKRSRDDKWIYPVSLPNGGRTFIFKTLLSNECVNNCKYCPLRAGSSAERCSLSPIELSKTFLSYLRAKKVSGLFLSSAVRNSPDNTMDGINRTARILRNSGFRGYIHLKIIPGASEAAIRETLGLASAVSLNMETPGEASFSELCTTKNYTRDILGTMDLINRLAREKQGPGGIKQTTQFVVGAARETDKEIVKTSWKLYHGPGLSRVYFSAYQRGAGSADLPGEASPATNKDILTREHRLYQADWLIRKYGFKDDEIPFTDEGNLSLELDPKEMWAKKHPEFFPVNLNKDDKYRLLRVPGLGEVMVDRILAFRKNSARIRSIEDLGKAGKLLKKAAGYVTF